MKTGFNTPRLLVLIVVVGIAAVQVPSAGGKVHVNPNGPAGQQYVLPLDSARGQASGTAAAGVPGSNTKPPLFGQGIKPDGPTAKQSHRSGAKRSGAEGSSSSAKASHGVSTETGTGDSQGLWVAAVIAAVVLLGGIAGLTARRRFSAEPRA